MVSVPSSASSADKNGLSDLYQAAAEVGKAALTDQVSELDSIRGRTVQFLAFIGTSTAFLAGISLAGKRAFSSGWFELFGIIGSVTFIALLLLLRGVLTGTRYWFGGKQMEWHFHLDPTAYTEWLDEQGVRVTASAFYRSLAQTFREQKVENDGYLKVIRARYLSFLFLGMLQLATWGALAWAYGARV